MGRVYLQPFKKEKENKRNKLSCMLELQITVVHIFNFEANRFSKSGATRRKCCVFYVYVILPLPWLSHKTHPCKMSKYPRS